MDLVENHPLLRFNHVLKDCDTTGSRVGSARSYYASDSSGKVFIICCLEVSGYMVGFCSIPPVIQWKPLTPTRVRFWTASEKLKDISTNRSSRFNDHLFFSIRNTHLPKKNSRVSTTFGLPSLYEAIQKNRYTWRCPPKHPDPTKSPRPELGETERNHGCLKAWKNSEGCRFATLFNPRMVGCSWNDLFFSFFSENKKKIQTKSPGQKLSKKNPRVTKE